MAEARYVPEGDPFHVEPDGFRFYVVMVGERERICVVSPTAVTYQGDMIGAVRFVERERRKLSR